MSYFEEFLSKLMDQRVHGHINFSALQFKTLYKLLEGEVKEISICKEVLESEEPGTQTTTVFEGEAKAFH